MNGQKRTVQVMLLVLITLLLVGCSAPETATPTLPPPTEEPTLAPPTQTPIPIEYYQDTGFPIGRFSSSESNTEALYFYADGSGKWTDVSGGETYGVDIFYGINGNLYSEMAFIYPTGPKVPVTYIWTFDGIDLVFTPIGEDLRAHRESVMGAVWTYKGPGFLGTEVKESTFPTGRFLSADGLRAFEFGEDGEWRFFDGDLETPTLSGKYVINGDFYTEMTHNNLDDTHVPVTYYWTFDGQNLTFELWGEDVIEYRESIYNGQTYILVDG